MRYPKQK